MVNEWLLDVSKYKVVAVEVPYIYRLYGPQLYIDRIQESTVTQRTTLACLIIKFFVQIVNNAMTCIFEDRGRG